MAILYIIYCIKIYIETKFLFRKFIETLLILYSNENLINTLEMKHFYKYCFGFWLKGK